MRANGSHIGCVRGPRDGTSRVGPVTRGVGVPWSRFTTTRRVFDELSHDREGETYVWTMVRRLSGH
jgi:hypothetical protein